MRRICWPEPDATCLEGGCTWCPDAEPRSEFEIHRYAQQAGQVPNRSGNGTKDAMQAYRYGMRFVRPRAGASR
jgi:hypothetical protein